MQKVSMELCRITKHLKLKFGLVVKGDDDKSVPIMSSFETNGNEYLTITPYPFITVDISNKKEKEWNPNQSFNISGMTKFLFTKRLRQIILEFKKEQKLFYERDGKLYVNKEAALKLKTLVPVGKGKTCLFIPVVVEDEETHDQYEGISMMINSPDNYSNMTFEEFECMLDTIEHTDLSALTLSILNTNMLIRLQKVMQLDATKLEKDIMLVAQRLYQIEKKHGE